MPRLLAIPFPIRLAVTVWAVLLVAVTVRVAVGKPLTQTVVPIYLTAAQRWLASENLYAAIPGMDLYRNPPGVAAAFVPLSLLPWKLAGILWRLGSAAVFLFGLFRFVRAATPDLPPSRAGWVFALAAVLLLQSVNNGQVNAVLAGAGLAGAAAAICGRWWECAAWCGLGFGLKIYPLAVAMLFALTAPRHLAPRIAAVALAVAALPFALHDPGYVGEQHRNFLHLLGLDDRTHAILRRAPRDWTVLPRVWLGVVPSATATKAVAMLAGLTLAAVVALAARAGADRRQTATMALALGTGWMTAFGPATESNTYSLWAGVAAWMAVRPSRSRWAKPLALAGCGLLASNVVRAMFPNDWQYTALGPQPLAALALMLSAMGLANLSGLVNSFRAVGCASRSSTSRFRVAIRGP